MKKRLHILLLSLIFSFIFGTGLLSCSFQIHEKINEETGSFSIKIPDRAAIAANDKTFSKVFFHLYDEKNNVTTSDYYDFGQTISVKDLAPGNYMAEVIFDNSNNLFIGFDETIEIVAGENVKRQIKVEKNASDTETNIAKLGTLKEVVIPTDESLVMKDDVLYSRKLYIFEKFNNDFSSIIKNKEYNAAQNNVYGRDFKNIPYAIEVMTFYDSQTLLPLSYNFFIFNNHNGLAYATYLTYEDFIDLTNNLSVYATAATAMDNSFETDINTYAPKLSSVTEPSNVTILPDSSFIPQHNNSETNLYSKRLYIYNDGFNEQITRQLQAKTSNCGFNYNEASNLIEQKKSFLQIEASYNKATNTIDYYELRFFTDGITFGQHGPGYCISNVSYGDLIKFMAEDPTFTLPEKEVTPPEPGPAPDPEPTPGPETKPVIK